MEIDEKEWVNFQCGLVGVILNVRLYSIQDPKFSTETCVICLDRKETPRDLDCGHSFCEDCINTYIAEFDKKIHAKCPLCRKQIYSTEPIVRAILISLQFIFLLMNHFTGSVPATIH